MFKKLVAIEPVSLIPSAEEKLHDYAKEVVMFGDTDEVCSAYRKATGIKG